MAEEAEVRTWSRARAGIVAASKALSGWHCSGGSSASLVQLQAIGSKCFSFGLFGNTIVHESRELLPLGMIEEGALPGLHYRELPNEREIMV